MCIFGFFGIPDDVDWCEVAATEYRYDPMSVTPDAVAVLLHNTPRLYWQSELNLLRALMSE